MTKQGGDGLTGELVIIADALEAIERKICALKQQTIGAQQGHPSAVDQAKSYYKSRRSRDALFGKPELFGEPAWDILIDLFIAGEEGKRVSVSSLCIAASVPPTTALRWISILEGMSLIDRTADTRDARRFFLALTSKSREQVRAYFERH